MAVMTDPRSEGGLFSRFRDTYLARRAQRAEYLRVRYELSCLTTRELEDIGVARADIEDIACKAAGY